MLFEELDLPGVYRIQLEPREDQRGFFARLFCRHEMEQAGLNPAVTQINNTLTRLPGTVRGLHFQRPPAAESRTIRCVRGAIRDVAVDLRADSPHFGTWTSIELNEENRTLVHIPSGFAHGFQTLRPDTELIYLHSGTYRPEHEDGISPVDEELDIDWPLEIACLSERDRMLPALHQVAPIVL